MISKEYIITVADGIHARPATALVRLARMHKSVIRIQKGEHSILLNSMLNILTMGAKGGDTITVTIEGDDEAEAAIAIEHFFKHELLKS